MKLGHVPSVPTFPTTFRPTFRSVSSACGVIGIETETSTLYFSCSCAVQF
jgi:hypothetical protein